MLMCMRCQCFTQSLGVILWMVLSTPVPQGFREGTLVTWARCYLLHPLPRRWWFHYPHLAMQFFFLGVHYQNWQFGNHRFVDDTSMRPFEPRKKILVKHNSKLLLFSFGVQMSGNKNIFFVGGEFTRTCMYFKAWNKMTHDCLRGYSFSTEFTRLGASCFFLYCYNAGFT